MIRALHFLAASILAVLVECVLGNFRMTFPLAVCILWFAGRKFPLPVLIGSGLAAGLFFDLLYFHSWPYDFCLFGAAVTAAWLIEKRTGTRSAAGKLVMEGIVLGILVFGGNVLLAAGGKAAGLFRFSSLFIILCCPLLLLLLQLLFCREKKRNVPHEEKKPAEKKSSGKTPGKKGKK